VVSPLGAKKIVAAASLEHRGDILFRPFDTPIDPLWKLAGQCQTGRKWQGKLFRNEKSGEAKSFAIHSL
jgi:hypothetical protein